jgi:hypothetical protein
MALMAATIGFCHWITSFDNRGLPQRMRALLGEDYSSRQATYDLRRLRRKQIICRIPGGHRYQPPRPAAPSPCCSPRPTGASSAPAAALDPQLPAGLARRSSLAIAWENLTTELVRFIDHGLAPA